MLPNRTFRISAALCCAFIVGCSALLAGSTAEHDQMQPLAANPRLLLWQTNSEGDDIHVFDAQTGALVRRLDVGPQPHGIAATSDGRTLFVTIEANGRSQGELIWIDGATFEIIRRIELCREPHALAATPDGRWLYVPCRDEHYWIIDGATGEVAGRIKTGGRPHNTQISADGRWAFLSPMGAPRAVTVVNIAAGHRVVGEIAFANAVRPSTLSPDGRWLAQHVDALNGFQVADTAGHRVIATVRHSEELPGLLQLGGLGKLGFDGFARCHGLGIRPDQNEIWSVCAGQVTVHSFNAPPFHEIARITLPHKGYWLTFSPDSRFAYVALSGAGTVVMIDVGARRIVREVTAGKAPKRNLVTRPRWVWMESP